MITIQKQDMVFFEEYKRLDKLCSDLYAKLPGVSAYIADMENNAVQGQAQIPSWNSDYKTLKHVRWVRNRLAHESCAEQLSSEADLAFIQDFYRRILYLRDPLYLLQQVRERKRAPGFKEVQDNRQNKIPFISAALICIGIILVFLAYTVFFYHT